MIIALVIKIIKHNNYIGSMVVVGLLQEDQLLAAWLGCVIGLFDFSYFVCKKLLLKFREKPPTRRDLPSALVEPPI